MTRTDRTDDVTVERSPTLNDFSNDPRWVAWREEERKKTDGTPYKTKIPYDPNHDRQARIPTKPSTWGTRKQAQHAWRNFLDDGRLGGIGIVLGELDDGMTLMGTDLDSCVDPKTGHIKPWATEVLDRFDTYAEVSPSGEGIKAFFLVAAKDADAVSRLMKDSSGKPRLRVSFTVSKHVEIALDRGRYYAVTDEWLNDWPDTLRTVSTDDVRWLIEEAGPRFLEQHGVESTKQSATKDESGSGHGFRFIHGRKAAGDTYEQAREAIFADQGKAGDWARRVDERQLKRAWDNNSGETRKLTTRTLDQFELRQTCWLWWPFIAREEVNCLYGDSAVGKSTMLYSMMACVTNGQPLPRFGNEREKCAPKGSVLIMTAEDSPETGIGPRMKVAGADMSKVHIVGYDVPDDPKGFDPFVVLNQIAQQLDDAITRIGDVQLVDIDPLTDFVGRVNPYIDAEARQQLLQPLLRLARKHKIAVVYVVHLNKKNDLSAKQRAMGAGALINMPRSSVLVGRDPNDYDRRIIVQAKTNLVPEGSAAAYRLTSARGSVLVEWEDDWVTMTADELLNSTPKPTKTDNAEGLLADMLADGPQKEKVVQAQAKANGISPRTLRRARDGLKIRSTKANGVWWLSLPATRRKI